jgi:hypothetical protein
MSWSSIKPWPLAGLLCAGLGILGAGVLFWFDPDQHAFYPVWAFHRVTGLQCPGCGSLRALHQLLHGRFAAAFHFNAVLVCSLPFLAWFALRFAVLKMRNQPATIAVRPAWLWSALAVIITFGVLRNLPVPQLAWLAP